jgi:hypothetical protein
VDGKRQADSRVQLAERRADMKERGNRKAAQGRASHVSAWHGRRLIHGQENATSRSVCRDVYATHSDSLVAGQLAFAPASCVSGPACCIQNATMMQPKASMRADWRAGVERAEVVRGLTTRPCPPATCIGRVWGGDARRRHVAGALVGRVDHVAAHRRAGMHWVGALLVARAR